LGQTLSAELLIDNSAWARLDQPAMPERRSEEVAQWIEQGRVAACVPFLLEAGYSARNADDYAEVLDELLSLPQIAIGRKVERRVLDVQRQLARVGHHRLPPVDLLIAAIADIHGLGILHYDHDYELLRDKSDLSFDSVWLVERGAL
jgi:predicted nucleic acid-binding protein